MTTPLEALAATLNLEYESRSAFVNEYSYQPTRTKAKIYTDGNDYYCVQAKEPKDEVGGAWALHPDQFWAQKAGTKLWVSKAKGESK